MAKKDKFKGPTGPKIESLSPRKYRFTWTKGQSYDKQLVEWGYNGDKKGSKELSGSAKPKCDVDLGFAPYPDGNKKVGSVYFIVKCVKGSKSECSSKKTFDIKKPKDLSAIKMGSLSSDENDAVTFKITAHPTNSQPVRDIYCESVFVKGATATKESNIKKEWSKGKEKHTAEINKSDGGTFKTHHRNMTEYGMIYMRAKPRNSQGDGEYKYSYFPWSESNQSTNVDTNPDKVEVDPATGTTSAELEWDFQANGLTQVEQVILNYTIGVPTAGMGLPSNPDWRQYATPDGFKKKVSGSINYVLDTTIPEDNCLWWRVDAVPPAYPAVPKAYGTPKLAKAGKLASPSLTGFTPDPETHIIEVTVEHKSQVEDSMTAVVYHDSSGESELEGKLIGLIPHNETSIEIEVPDWGNAEIGVEIYEIAGASFIDLNTPSGYTYYELKRYEKSVSASFEYDQPWDANYCIITVPDILDFDDASLREGLNVTFSADVSEEAQVITKRSKVASHWFGDPPVHNRAFLKYFTVYTKKVKCSSPASSLNKNQVMLLRNNDLLKGSRQTLVTGYVNYIERINPNVDYMTSDTGSEAESVSVPQAPDNLAAVQVDNKPIIQVTWDMNWEECDGTEISWADHEDAWYSTSGPNTYEVDNIRSPKLNLADTSLGTTWYIRARFYKNADGGNKIYGPYSEIDGGISTASSPNIPSLELSDSSISSNGYVSASWVYVTNDTTPQKAAILGEVIDDTNEGPYTDDDINQFASPEILTQQRVTLYAEDMGWENGTTHNLVVKVQSESGKWSGWSKKEPLSIVPNINCQITNVSEALEYINDVQNPLTYSGTSVSFSGGTEDALKELYHLIINIDPIEEDSKYVVQTGTVLTFNDYEYNIDWSLDTNTFYGGTLDAVTGELTNLYTRDKGSVSEVTNIDTIQLSAIPGTNTASASTGNISVTTADYFTRGYFLRSMPLTVTAEGSGGDGTLYFIIARDGDYPMLRPNEETTLGPDDEIVYRNPRHGDGSDTITVGNLISYLDDGASYTLRVVAIDNAGQIDEARLNFKVDWSHQALDPDTYTYGSAYVQNGVGVIAINNLQGTEAGDHIDIYRLTADKPQLIYREAQFGEVYIDPYPTIGPEGGYRLVYVTNNGDYIVNNMLAWQDYNAEFDTKFQLINFGNTEIEFKYNVSLDNSWKKKFTQTNYLGGSIQGDWDTGTTFETSVSGNTFYDLEPEVYEQLRDLADYEGICHIRTIDGTNICCNIEVSDNSTYNSLEHQHDISLSIQKVDNIELDGMTLEEWQYINEEE